MEVTIKTREKRQVVDITDIIADKVTENSWDSGVVNIFAKHTTCCLTTADLDPGTDKDMLDAFEKMFPKGDYQHPHDPEHVGDHIMSSLIGPSVSVPIENGQLLLGTWQRIVLIEFDGPRERDLNTKFIKGDS